MSFGHPETECGIVAVTPHYGGATVTDLSCGFWAPAGAATLDFSWKIKSLTTFWELYFLTLFPFLLGTKTDLINMILA